MKKFTKFKLLCLFALVVTLAFTSCSKSDTQEKNSKNATDSTSSNLPTTDRAGNSIKIDKTDKIVCLAPSTNQILEELGLIDKLVAVDTQTPSYIKSVSDLPQYDLAELDCESLLALEPDILFISGLSNYNNSDKLKTLKDNGVCLIEIPSSESIDAIKTDIEFVSSCFGLEDKGKEITSAMQKEIDTISSISSKIDDKDKKSVMFEIANAPNIYSFGTNTYLNEMIELIGAKNVFADQKSWIPVTEESAVSANPDVILTDVNYIDKPVDEILSRKNFENVSAVKNKQVYYIDNTSASLPNQNIIKALKEMAKAVYPEQYKDIK